MGDGLGAAAPNMAVDLLRRVCVEEPGKDGAILSGDEVLEVMIRKCRKPSYRGCAAGRSSSQREPMTN